jgi:hypothetical protein
MAIEYVSIAAASATVDSDLLSDAVFQSATRGRQLVAAALTGSAAAGDTEVRLAVGSVQVGKLFNSGTGFPDNQQLFNVGAGVPSNTSLHAYVVDAPATNPINLVLDIRG